MEPLLRQSMHATLPAAPPMRLQALADRPPSYKVVLQEPATWID
jgi:hypothetical protein